ncbi:ketosynthase chain-length factor [Streptomyces pristinaespiralis]|uniref:Actinorhodin polyketide beta-ketoacyl synthase beta subunit n=2 Tax=Streptomyces pristinaespiralis TaxID=38300 RepID=B5HIV1_STRE2|nr:ketosynthase chain-length factor [Streptomyces pristinaespiralis]ALC18573.1 beta-ketoacyl synthase [Streptomyces pristinaespiralis]ALC25392.1 beta-ketoacyl synthase [Streptomyces pristinaespiralis]EDY66762.1 actinorhodin polyketide beta-ketoacyl synthase beta subunit [Streptomyces pristinaespiralis ATCC 25486]QMU12393.1 ketosynthase chain-length factor [Streptomyces pristinaespiralis]CBW45716.1 putative ketoacylsynthase, chain length factor beta-subunit [Streptomyces pristinaespiralis]
MTVVFTGLGVMAPNGQSTEEFWTATLEQRSGIGPLERFDARGYPSRLAGQIRDFKAAQALPGRLLPQTDRVTRLALVAAQAAIEDSGIDLESVPDLDMGVISSNAHGGFEFTHREIQKLWTKGPESVSVYESFAWFCAANTGQISIRHGMRGSGSVLVADQSGGLDALALARRTIRRGTPLTIAGGVESSYDPWGWVSHLATGRISEADDPQRAFLPFDTAASGYVPGEGGAYLILQDAQAAREREGACVYGELAGHAATFDPRPGSGRPPALAAAIRGALKDARITPEEVDVVFADASGVPELDRVEAEALAAVFGPCGVPVSAPKALTGRLYAGGAPLDVVAALLSLRDQIIPATAHVTDVPDEYRLDLVTGRPRRAELHTALVVARGNGGYNSAMVVRS